MNSHSYVGVDEYPRCESSRRGSALVAVFLVVCVVSLVLGGLAAGAHQRMLILRDDTDFSRALSIADAGAAHAFGLLANNPQLGDGGGVVVDNNDFSGGRYRVTSESIGPNLLLVTSEGFYRNHTAVAAATLRLNPDAAGGDPVGGPQTPTLPVSGMSAPLMILAGSTLTMSGGINANLGSFAAHANGDIILSGGPNITASALSAVGSITLEGNPQLHLDGGNGQLHANDHITLRGNINADLITANSIAGNWGTTTQATTVAPTVSWPNWFSPMPPKLNQPVNPVPELPLPSLDVPAFKSTAEQNAWHYEGNQDITRGWLTQDILQRTGQNVHNNETLVAPQGGVMFVNGNVQIASDMRFEGVIVATGNVTIGGAATFNNTTPYPAIVSVNGNISIAGGAQGPTVNGWIYAMEGSVTASGGASGAGIVAKQNVTISGGYGLGTFASEALLSPGQTGGSPGTGGGGSSGGAGSGGTPDIELLSWIQ